MEITKSDIKRLIKVKKKDTFINHFLTVFTRDFKAKGEVRSSEISFWSQSYWTGPAYPVFTFKLNTENHLIDITDRINPVGRIFYIGFILFLTFLFTPRDLNSINWSGYWPILLATILFMGFFIFVTTKLYQFEKKQQLKEIFEILDIEIENEKIEKEWSWKNILIRMFTYPFCIFLIGLNIFLIIPEGNFGLALGSFGFVGFYLFTDLKMIFRKKTGNNV